MKRKARMREGFREIFTFEARKSSRSRKPRNGEMIRRSEVLRGARGLINP